MDIEKEYRRFDDFGLIVGLAFGIAALGVTANAFVGDGWTTTIRNATFGLLGLLAFVTLLVALFVERASPNVKPRSIRERICAAFVGVACIAGCGMVFLWLT